MQRLFKPYLKFTRSFSSNIMRVPEDERLKVLIHRPPTESKAYGIDIGGTIDQYCLAPKKAFYDACRKHHWRVSYETISKFMGMGKEPQLFAMYLHEYNKILDKKLAHEIYNEFLKILLALLAETVVTPEAIECSHKLYGKGKKIYLLTAYGKDESAILTPLFIKQGLRFEMIINSSHVKNSRPHSSTAEKIKDEANILNSHECVIVGDTRDDILSGFYANMWTVGALEYSAALNINSLEEANQLTEEEREKRYNRLKNTFAENGANYILFSLKQLPELAEQIDLRLKHGHSPSLSFEREELTPSKKLIMA